jgi:hypothetical protein
MLFRIHLQSPHQWGLFLWLLALSRRRFAKSRHTAIIGKNKITWKYKILPAKFARLPDLDYHAI